MSSQFALSGQPEGKLLSPEYSLVHEDKYISIPERENHTILSSLREEKKICIQCALYAL